MLAALFALLVPANAEARGGSYTFSGGSELARAEVQNALEASAFDWDLVAEPVTIQIVDCGCAGARPGVIVLDETLLESTPYGRAYTWGIVQHEYAHQVWCFTLGDAQRRFLQEKLGGADLCYEQPGLPHDAHACERFAKHARLGVLAKPKESRSHGDLPGRTPLPRADDPPPWDAGAGSSREARTDPRSSALVDRTRR